MFTESCSLRVYDARGEAGPVLETSDVEAIHNRFVVRDTSHSAVIDVVCSPLPIAAFPGKTYHIVQAVFVPCCDISLSTYRECISRYIGEKFEPGRWIDGEW